MTFTRIHLVLLSSLLSIVVLTGCVSLKHVSEFSDAAKNGLSGYDDLPYSYEQHCLDLCTQGYEESILTGKVNFVPAKDTTCNCDKEKSKDNDADKAYSVLQLYFSGLEKLADGDKFNYKSDDLVAAMTNAKVIRDTAMQVPVTGILNIVMNMATNAYREHALEKILGDAKNPVDKLLEDLINSNRFLEREYQGYYSRYLRLLALKYANDKHINGAEQMNDYMVNRAEQAKDKEVTEKLEAFNAQLQKIKDAHLKLANERMNLKDKDLITYLFTQASQLRTNINSL